MKSKNLAVRSAKNWKYLLKLYNDKFAKTETQWVFRGLRDASYELETSLERVSRRFGRNLNALTKIEKK